MTRARIVLAHVLVAVLLAALPANALASSRAKDSFAQIQSDLMCVACHEPLAVAKSPEAFSERQYIRQLIAAGLSQSQIERQMVAQYGPAVLARPPASGFNLLIYILPPAVLIAGAAFLLYTLPRWRRRTRQQASAEPARTGPELDPADARRLDDELSRQP